MSPVKRYLFAGLVLYAAVGAAAPQDFWEKSKALKTDLFERRRILVSVIDEGNRTEFKGVGLVKASFDKTWGFATNPEKIRKFAKGLDHFDWDLKTGKALARFHVLWKEFVIQAKTDIKKEAKPPHIAFDFVEGSWIRISGQLEILPHDKGNTLVVLRARTPEGQKAGWHFAMEAVLHRIAGSLREAVEKD